MDRLSRLEAQAANARHSLAALDNDLRNTKQEIASLGQQRKEYWLIRNIIKGLDRKTLRALLESVTAKEVSA